MKKKITALTIVLMTLISIGANAQTIRGDVNGDNQVTESDITSNVNVFLGRSDISEDRADVNKDRVVNVADVCTEINIIAEWKKTAQTLTGGSTEEVADMLAALSRAKALREEEITATISVSGMYPLSTLSINAWRFVPPPETSTTTLNICPFLRYQ